jgi:hypothetical protein
MWLVMHAAGYAIADATSYSCGMPLQKTIGMLANKHNANTCSACKHIFKHWHLCCVIPLRNIVCGAILFACIACCVPCCLQRFYTHLHSYLMAGRFADRLQPWLDAFAPDR